MHSASENHASPQAVCWDAQKPVKPFANLSIAGHRIMEKDLAIHVLNQPWIPNCKLCWAEKLQGTTAPAIAPRDITSSIITLGQSPPVSSGIRSMCYLLPSATAKSFPDSALLYSVTHFLEGGSWLWTMQFCILITFLFDLIDAMSSRLNVIVQYLVRIDFNSPGFSIPELSLALQALGGRIVSFIPSDTLHILLPPSGLLHLRRYTGKVSHPKKSIPGIICQPWEHWHSQYWTSSPLSILSLKSDVSDPASLLDKLVKGINC